MYYVNVKNLDCTVSVITKSEEKSKILNDIEDNKNLDGESPNDAMAGNAIGIEWKNRKTN